MSLELLARQLSRRDALVSSDASASVIGANAAKDLADALDGKDIAEAAPTSAASFVFDAAVARKVVQARRALDPKANVRAHVEKWKADLLPEEYTTTMTKVTRVAQQVFRKAKNKAKAKRDTVRVPLEEKAAMEQKRRDRKKRISAASAKKR